MYTSIHIHRHVSSVIGSHPSPYLTSVLTACSPWSHLSLFFLSLARRENSSMSIVSLSGKLLAASCSENWRQASFTLLWLPLQKILFYSLILFPFNSICWQNLEKVKQQETTHRLIHNNIIPRLLYCYSYLEWLQFALNLPEIHNFISS